MVAASVLGWLVASRAFAALRLPAIHAGVPLRDTVSPGILGLLLLTWLHVALHECGHAFAARMVGVRVKVLAIGPAVFSWESGRMKTRFQWRGLLMLGGYMGSVPAGPQDFRVKQMIIVAAGPLTSIFAGTLFFELSFLLPANAFGGWWPWLMMGAMIGFYVGVVNLLPFGYCDGTMLFHLLLKTRRAEELQALILRGAVGAAAMCPQDYEDELAVRRSELQQLLESPTPDAVRQGRQYIRLASIEQAARHWRDAEAHTLQGLDLLPAGAEPAWEATGWETLQFLRMARFDYPGSMEAYRKAIDAAALLSDRATTDTQRLEAEFRLARLHSRAQCWDAALAHTSVALALCPVAVEPRAQLLSISAQALLRTGRVEAGLEATRQAATLLRTQTTGVKGPHGLGSLADFLWRAGRAEEALPLARECIVLLEARGALRLGASFRLYFAEVLRVQCRFAHAACVLPLRANAGSMDTRYLEVRGSIRRHGDRLPAAIADLTAVVECQLRQSPVDEVAVAVARGKLADALAASGAWEEAERMVAPAYERLAAAGHPEAAAASITLAVVSWRKTGAAGSEVEAALRIWSANQILAPADKAREMELAGRKLDAAGYAEGAARCRESAQVQWQSMASEPAVSV
jgi:tetratricopeptide (TPR) repeat protein